MALVTPTNLLGAQVCKSGPLGQQIYWQVRACGFDAGRAQLSLQRETETAAIKVDAIKKLGHFDKGMHEDYNAALNACISQ